MSILFVSFGLFGSFVGEAGAQSRIDGYITALTRQLKPLGALEPESKIDAVFVLSVHNSEDLDNLAQVLYDPRSPEFHKFLSPQDFQARYSPSDSDLSSVEAFAKAHNLVVEKVSTDRLLVHVSGKASDFQSAFHIKLQTYRHPVTGEIVFAPDVAPTIESGVPIHAIHGLNNFPKTRPASLSGLMTDATAQPLPSAFPASGVLASPYPPVRPYGSFGGTDFRAAYAPGVTEVGAGQTVGILIEGDYSPQDISLYESLEGIPNVKLQNVFLDGAMLATNNCADVNAESNLDIEQVISMAPGIKQVSLYGIAGDHDALDALDEMATPTQGEPLPLQITASYWFFYSNEIDNMLQKLYVQGQAFFTASGDNGAYSAYTPQSPSIDTLPFPPVDFPLVTAVGGTVLSTDSHGNWASEQAWSGSGGGSSPWFPSDSHFKIPPWQTDMNWSANAGSTVARNVPDVAMVASNIRITRCGTYTSVGGTSAASPLWAGFAALANERAAKAGKMPLGNLNVALYSIGKGANYGTSFHDIIVGNNSHVAVQNGNAIIKLGTGSNFQAVQGFDLVTGWGTPAGSPLIDQLVSASPKIGTPAPVNCPATAAAIKSLEQRVSDAQARLTTPDCSGPARLLCTKALQSLQQQLQLQISIYLKGCPGSALPE